jgi:hypothetical protein
MARAWKQERRGGIETTCRELASIPEVAKQERRGGIEIAQRARIHRVEPGSRNALVAFKKG